MNNIELFTNAKTGKVWMVGEDVECLTAELRITPADAESYLGYGQDAGQILAMFRDKELWKKVIGANNRIAFMRGCIKSQAGRMPAVNQLVAAQERPATIKAPAIPAAAPKACREARAGIIWKAGDNNDMTPYFDQLPVFADDEDDPWESSNEPPMPECYLGDFFGDINDLTWTDGKPRTETETAAAYARLMAEAGLAA